MLSTVLQILTEFFKVKIMLLSSNGDTRSFCSQLPGNYPVIYFLSNNNEVLSVYGKEMSQIENDLESNFSSVVLNPPMIYESIPSPGMQQREDTFMSSPLLPVPCNLPNPFQLPHPIGIIAPQGFFQESQTNHHIMKQINTCKSDI